MKIEIPHQDIAARAYILYQKEGCCDGNHLQHWIQAENDLKEAHKDARASAEVIPAVAQVEGPHKV